MARTVNGLRTQHGFVLRALCHPIIDGLRATGSAGATHLQKALAKPVAHINTQLKRHSSGGSETVYDRPFRFSKERNGRGDFRLEWKSRRGSGNFSGREVDSFGMIRLRTFFYDDPFFGQFNYDSSGDCRCKSDF